MHYTVTMKCANPHQNKKAPRGEEIEMNKFEVVEAIAEEYEITYDQAFDLVYDLFGDPDETDDAI